MNKLDWKSFLEKLNQKIFQNVPQDYIPPGLIESGWLGYPPASEEKILITEKRLNVHLPPSYREFLKTSNGWGPINEKILRLYSVEDIGMFKTSDQDIIDSFVKQKLKNHDTIESLTKPTIPDKDYFVYGKDQSIDAVRIEYIQNTIKISIPYTKILADNQAHLTMVLLNPDVITADGEWETWLFSNGNSGTIRFRSFSDFMMEVLYQAG